MEKIERIKLWEKAEGIALMSQLGFKTGDVILDFGSNIGHYAFALARLVGEEGKVIAYDQNENALSIIESYKQQESIFNIETMISRSNNTLPFKDDSLDGILFFDILHHLIETQTQLIEESYRTLKLNGKLAILPFHYSDEAKQDLTKLALRLGFKELKILKYAGPHFEHFKNKLPKETPLEHIEKGDIYLFTK